MSFAEAGWAVTSGLALGIDASSHRGSLAAKGITIGVAGTGLHHIYPRSHRGLVDEIITASDKAHSLCQNFLLPVIAASSQFSAPQSAYQWSSCSLGVLVVEAALKSGSLLTVKHALEQGRDVFAVPGSIHNPLARGCHYLIRQGAGLVESARDVIEELSFFRSRAISDQIAANPAKIQPQFPSFFTQIHVRILELIEYEITPVNVIILRSGLTAGEVSSILLSLELNGYIQSVPGVIYPPLCDKSVRWAIDSYV